MRRVSFFPLFDFLQRAIPFRAGLIALPLHFLDLMIGVGQVKFSAAASIFSQSKRHVVIISVVLIGPPLETP